MNIKLQGNKILALKVLLIPSSCTLLFCALVQTFLVHGAQASEVRIQRIQSAPSSKLDFHPIFPEKLEPRTAPLETKSISIVLQLGTNLTAKILASGTQNYTYIQQIGKSQTALILQNGSENFLTLDQEN